MNSNNFIRLSKNVYCAYQKKNFNINNRSVKVHLNVEVEMDVINIEFSSMNYLEM